MGIANRVCLCSVLVALAAPAEVLADGYLASDPRGGGSTASDARPLEEVTQIEETIRQDRLLAEFVGAVDAADRQLGALERLKSRVQPFRVQSVRSAPDTADSSGLTIEDVRGLLTQAPTIRSALRASKSTAVPESADGIAADVDTWLENPETLVRALDAGSRLRREHPMDVEFVPADVTTWRARRDRLRSFVDARMSVDRIAIVESGRRRASTLADIRSLGFFLRRTLGSAGNPEGANFAFDRDLDGDDNTFKAKFCVGWQPKFSWVGASGGTRVSGNAVFAVQGDLADSRPHHENLLTVIGGVDLRWDFSAGREREFPDRRTRWLDATATIEYLRAQDDSIEDVRAKVRLEPKIGAVALGVRRGHENLDYVTRAGIWGTGCCEEPRNQISGQWGVGVALQAGHRRDDVAGFDDGYLHAGLTVSGRIYFDGAARLLNGDAWDPKNFPFVEAKWTNWFSTVDSVDARDAFEVQLIAPLGPVLRIEAVYHDGYDPDADDDTETLSISLAALI